MQYMCVHIFVCIIKQSDSYKMTDTVTAKVREHIEELFMQKKCIVNTASSFFTISSNFKRNLIDHFIKIIIYQAETVGCMYKLM